MTTLLRNKVIVITGSSSGIGRAIALSCAQQGATLVLHHLGNPQTHQDAESLHRELQDTTAPAMLDGRKTSHLMIGADLTTDDAPNRLISQTISTFGRIDTLVNNAGICQFAPAGSVTKALLAKHVDVNFTAAWLLTQAATEEMVRRNRGGGGSVVSIASITAVRGSKELAHYAPTKAALLAMSKSFAVEFGRYGIRYNCVLPGTIQTTMNEKDLAVGGKKKWMEERVPLGRLGRPEDIAGGVVFFASELSKYVSGEQLLIDGGASVYYQ
ncbi:hypothetical protein FE257_009432 [Aspergillus nanangensis]|uniref:Uncharacterized protein n=1 Tax=Aspergillus nanangensis TaxID=2582783 RepID=A0AAD4CJZ5_ASPNN|nr:hypothetical protein FE257_009432 [Aspergillus nanangensis]